MDTGSDIIYNYRSLPGIIEGCLSTILLCIWISLHPNVPLAKRNSFPPPKLKLMLLSLVAPEVTLGFAARQALVARWVAKKHSVSLTHAFFYTMGGFETCNGHPIVAQNQLEIYLSSIRMVKQEEIKDKSKKNTMLATIMVVQILWFIGSYATRIYTHLPVSALEIVTFSLTLVHITIWILWRKKPKDVGYPITLKTLGFCSRTVDTANAATPNPPHYLGEIPPEHSSASDHYGYYRHFDPMSVGSVPLYWCMTFEEGPSYLPLVLLLQIICATVLGAIYCSAWNIIFASSIEMWMWRVSASLTTALPWLCLIFLKISNRCKHNTISRHIFASINHGLIALLLLTRVLLLGISLTTLRHMPEPMFLNLKWNIVFPHV
ncbi:hypothetical protein R3P38DRAFT_2628998 [Favolaschia claudopus]|uniref:Uncharacterized protein n=1 Tax=Favolaschia claudopus TaxID=2862362 RepID=A0AAW0B996_9AGAR